jgi:hypothetical protein
MPLQLMQSVKHAPRISLVDAHSLPPLNPLTISGLIKHKSVVRISTEPSHFAQLPATTRFTQESAPPATGFAWHNGNLNQRH